MSSTTRILSLMALYCAAGAAWAQQPAPPPATPPAKATAQSEAGEPRADTSTSAAPSLPAARTPAAVSPAAVSPAAASPAAMSAAAAASPAATPSKASTRRGAQEPAAGQKSPAKTDRLELSTATVTGDREQPKVMYIVPWKRSDIGDLAGKPMNSLVDEILAPVDRDVFKREVVYYGAVQAEASQIGAPPKRAPQGEK